MTDPIKSMPLFFIDNQGAWPANENGTCDATLIGDAFVVWPDKGRYPTYAGISIATHPAYDGLIVVQAGNRGIVISFVPGAKTGEDVKVAFRTMENVEQYRVAVDSVVHRMLLWKQEQMNPGMETSDVDPLALMSWLASSEKGRAAAIVLMRALSSMLERPQEVTNANQALEVSKVGGDAFTVCDGLLTSLQQGMAFRAAQAAPAVAAPKRRE